eukprot:TRINITY_DN33429_c0_g1_i1.p1 TRINITY_DN33429_c0_g1~~TRINITY_DN33429_c0_g1_i1.p1  ORF type:complete len:159 (-),score=2.97 TRINITY_DN33429_c0_g1_i1:127-603(-)
MEPSANCGGRCDKYEWEQGDSDVTVRIVLPAGTRARDCFVETTSSHISAGLKEGRKIFLSGPLFSQILSEDTTWSIETPSSKSSDPNPLLVITLWKANASGHEEWWTHVVPGEAVIDLAGLKPPPKSIHDLDPGAQATIAKMMHEQEQQHATTHGVPR